MKFDHYTLRHPVIEDAQHIYELIMNNRPRLIDYFPIAIGSIHSVTDTEQYIKLKIKQAHAKEAITYLIVDDKTNLPIGFTFIKNFDWSIPKAELAYYIEKDYEGKGITSKALQLAITYCFDTLKMKKLFLRTAKDNIGSQRVALKNGFLLEGVLRQDFKIADGTLIDLHYYGLIKN
jgi:ribosomal-protein-serine acetyltransferase